MPSFTAEAIERALDKLHAVEEQGGPQRKFKIYDDSGRLVASTLLSRSWRRPHPITSHMVGMIRRELRLQGYHREFQNLIACPLTRSQYLALVSPPNDVEVGRKQR